ncbi:DUF2442 domain-containing protein [Mycobacterium koreense]|nr:DUF2442 domain-containing protein [Mycolicibacillus koreensis]BBY54016.1 hypothetical protein MKOR_12670 [Mycolicibacillus koreensis]
MKPSPAEVTANPRPLGRGGCQIVDRPDPGVFESLRREDFFRRMRVLDGLVTWPGELDLDPKAMYDESH